VKTREGKRLGFNIGSSIVLVEFWVGKTSYASILRKGKQNIF
jgi:hypothetical protein